MTTVRASTLSAQGFTATSQLSHSLPGRDQSILDHMAEQTGAKLLVVDDEPNIVELLAASLRFAGFEVHTG